MAQLIIEDLEPQVIEQLEVLAKEHGRSLQAELKHILNTAVESNQTHRLPNEWEVAKRMAALMHQQIAADSGITEPQLTEGQQDLSAVVEGLRALRKKISLGGLTVREMIEEGRRF